ncbi:MAG: ClbS/DfsB family four-helix bundle protein [Anaerolineales bacterium]|nr:ClbS/DfsB family four-helix bundle protein [Anaerolineales bacterium]
MDEKSPITEKTALLDVIRRERKNLESLLSGLLDSQMVEPGVEGQWSIKDVMSHIAAWERLAQDRILAALTNTPLKYPVIHGDEFVDKFNAQVFSSNKETPLDDIICEFRAAHTDFLAQIEQLDKDVILQKLPFEWAGKMTFQVLISANTHWHYIEHAESIEKWLERQAK